MSQLTVDSGQLTAKPETVKCLSVQQPWASWIVGAQGFFGTPVGGKKILPKDVENRTWETLYRGPLVIHASKKMDWEGLKSVDYFGWNHERTLMLKRQPSNFPKGVILGQVFLHDCGRNIDSPWAILGMFHWRLLGERSFASPVPWRGQLGLFNVPVSALEGQFLDLDWKTP